MSDTEGSLDGFVYDGLRFTDGPKGSMIISDEFESSIILLPHHLQVLRAVLNGTLVAHEVDES